MNQIYAYKKFIFAISDHDGIEGVKEALKISLNIRCNFGNIFFDW